MSQAAVGAGEVTRTIVGVAGAAEETGAAARDLLAAALDVSRRSRNLDGEAGRFLSGVRTA